jgi:hypothetical protein
LVNWASLGARQSFVIWCIANSGGEESAADRILWLSWLNLDQTELIFKAQRETRMAREHHPTPSRRLLGGLLDLRGCKANQLEWESLKAEKPGINTSFGRHPRFADNNNKGIDYFDQENHVIGHGLCWTNF